jgi:7-cyano-7-deazaguanine synthase
VLGAAAWRTVEIDLRGIGGSSLTSDSPVPKSGEATGIPSTYVPARNTLFLSYALAVAEVTGATAIYIGVNALDYSGYPDCRPEYIAAFQAMADIATRAGVQKRGPRIEAPLIDMTKAQIIAEGTRLGVDFSLTSSCYDPSPGGTPCGACDSCRLRAKGFTDLGMTDPLLK